MAAGDSGLDARPPYKHDPAYDSGFLEVGSIHRIHYEQYGKPDGKPVLFLHGGPGGSTSIKSTIYFDPAVYRVILLDQRGAGKSTPSAELRENTSQHLVADLETLRSHLGITKWHMVFGGSWGSTLALLYAQDQPSRVGSLVLRGLFTATKAEFDFSRGPDGCARLFPELYEEWVNGVPEADRDYPAGGYYKMMTSDDHQLKVKAARDYNKWFLIAGSVNAGPNALALLDDEHWTLSHGRLELHYHVHDAFLEPNQIMNNLDKIKHIPCSIVHGRMDVMCFPKVPYELHKAWPESNLHFIPVAGHSAAEPGIQNKLIEICDTYGKESFHAN